MGEGGTALQGISQLGFFPDQQNSAYQMRLEPVSKSPPRDRTNNQTACIVLCLEELMDQGVDRAIRQRDEFACIRENGSTEFNQHDQACLHSGIAIAVFRTKPDQGTVDNQEHKANSRDAFSEYY